MNHVYNKTLYEMGKWLLAAAVAAAFFVWVKGDSWLVKFPNCVFESLTGLYCPGCGGTRSAIALFRGRLIKSFFFHPAVPYAFVVYIVFMVKMFLLKHFNIGREHDGRILVFIYIGIGIVIVQWIVKLVLLVGYGIRLI